MYRRQSHGRFCRKRSFETNCKICGHAVLYWECYHGVKVFFDYPIYGKPFSHRCPQEVLEKLNATKGKPTYGTFKVVKSYQEIMKEQAEAFIPMYRCPVCNNKFTDLNKFLSHIHSGRKNNEKHRIYFRKFKLIPQNAKEVENSKQSIKNESEIIEDSIEDLDFDFDDLFGERILENGQELQSYNERQGSDQADDDGDEDDDDDDDDDDAFFSKFGDLHSRGEEKGDFEFDPDDYRESINLDVTKGRHRGFIPMKKGKYTK